MPMNGVCTIYRGHVLEMLKKLPDESVHTVCTSPPYYGLRDYGTEHQIWGGDPGCAHEWLTVCIKDAVGGTNSLSGAGKTQPHARNRRCAFCKICNAWKGELGQEPAPELFIQHLTAVFREVRRVLRRDGTLWIVIGDSYAGSGKGGSKMSAIQMSNKGSSTGIALPVPPGVKSKDLLGIPWMLAFALRKDGWYLRSDIIWCLSGDSSVYIRDRNGDRPMSIRQMYRRDPFMMKLWNGKKWTQVLAITRVEQKQEVWNITLRSGETICCTADHRFPTGRGLLKVREIVVGDVLKRTKLPQPSLSKSHQDDRDAAWLAGLYLAGGSCSRNTILISGRAAQRRNWPRCRKIAGRFGGRTSLMLKDGRMSIRLHGKKLVGAIRAMINGRVAETRCFSSAVWRHDNSFLMSLMEGYLAGNGYRLRLVRNHRLAADIRCACARLGWSVRITAGAVLHNGKNHPLLEGEIIKQRNAYADAANWDSVVSVEQAGKRFVYDIAVKDAPHTFALSGGLLTHNSKPNPMPTSAQDRCTTAHEYIFMLSKSERYFYDHVAIQEPACETLTEIARHIGKLDISVKSDSYVLSCNKRDVWTVPLGTSRIKHFAIFPQKLILPCILAGTSNHGCCAKCGAPYYRRIKRKRLFTRPGRNTKVESGDPLKEGNRDPQRHLTIVKTIGWEPGCNCCANRIPCTVLDPFCGSGTTLRAAIKRGRRAIGIELNQEFVGFIKDSVKRGLQEKGFNL